MVKDVGPSQRSAPAKLLYLVKAHKFHQKELLILEEANIRILLTKENIFSEKHAPSMWWCPHRE